MKIEKLDTMTRGWFIGNFEPSMYKCDFEVGVKEYKKGDIEHGHIHKLAKEFTVFLSGKARMNNIYIERGDIVQIDEFEPSDFECIEDCITLVVKTKSAPNDKYEL
jgi:hypothetical protein